MYFLSFQIDTLVNPLKSSVRTVGQAVRSMPDNLLSTVDGVMDGLSRVFQTKPTPSKDEESMKVGASLDQEVLIGIHFSVLLDHTYFKKTCDVLFCRQMTTFLSESCCS